MTRRWPPRRSYHPRWLVPDQPDRDTRAEAGRPSMPWYRERSGSTAVGQADVPVPEEWEASDLAAPRASVAGRGYIEVTIGVDRWDPDTHSDLLQVVEGPTPVTIKLHRDEGGAVVESVGETAVVQQYRYGSTDPGTWNRLVVWVLERNGTFTIAEVGYPEFPDDLSFPGSADTRNQSLTGLDPVGSAPRRALLRLTASRLEPRGPEGPSGGSGLHDGAVPDGHEGGDDDGGRQQIDGRDPEPCAGRSEGPDHQQRRRHPWLVGSEPKGRARWPGWRPARRSRAPTATRRFRARCRAGPGTGTGRRSRGKPRR